MTGEAVELMIRYVYVTRDWNYRELGYFTAVQSLTMTVFGIVGGALMWATHRFKVCRAALSPIIYRLSLADVPFVIAWPETDA